MYCMGGGNPRLWGWGLVSAWQYLEACICIWASRAELECGSLSCWGEGVESSKETKSK